MPGEQPPRPPEEATQERSHPRVWIGSWADYNEGTLHGRWIDAARDPGEIQADIDQILQTSPVAKRHGVPSEEWGVFDHEGFGSLQVSEQASLDYLSELARGIVEHGPAYAAFAAMHDGGELVQDFDGSYLGHYDSMEAYVEEVIDDLGYEEALDQAIPAGLRPYVRIDVGALARDVQLGGDLYVERADDQGVWLFVPE